MTRPIPTIFALLVAAVTIACDKNSPASDAPSDGATSSTTPDEASGAEASAAEAVPPSVPKLEPLADAKPLGAKMWRRFGAGEWTARAFYVPGADGEITIAIDMQGGGEALVDPFTLNVGLDNLELVEGKLEIPGRVPPGMSRRETLKVRAKSPGTVQVLFTTMKEGTEGPGPSGCLQVTDAGVVRCTEAQAGGKKAAVGSRSVMCCAKGKGEKGESCVAITDSVDSLTACGSEKKFALVCDGKIACSGKSCTCD